MVNNSKILAWLKEGLDKGYSEEQMESQLLKKGFSQEEVEKALKDIKKEKIKPKRKTKIVIFVIVIIALLIIVSFFLLKRPSEEEKLRQACIKAQTGLCLALLTDDENWCEKEISKGIIVKDDSNNCNSRYYTGKAFRANDISLCSKMNDSDDVIFCKAISTKNNDLCRDMKNNESMKICNSIVLSIKSNDCDKLDEPQLKGLCFVLTTKDKKYCEYFAEKC